VHKRSAVDLNAFRCRLCGGCDAIQYDTPCGLRSIHSFIFVQFGRNTVTQTELVFVCSTTLIETALYNSSSNSLAGGVEVEL
jgi:hypothetical protein